MNLNSNDRAHRFSLGAVTPRGINNRRTILADTRTTGRQEPVFTASTGIDKMGVDDDRSTIYGGSLAASQRNEIRLFEMLSNDIRPFQSLGTHQCQLRPAPAPHGMKWLDIRERKHKPIVKSDLEIKRDEERRLKERREELNSEKRRMEKERLERERVETGKLDKERLEKERLEKERLEKERLEKERLEKERLEKERLEKERLEKERLEKERLEKERLEKERLEKERIEKERLEKERLEKERLEKERLEKERLEKERLEKERLEKERLEKDRLEKERLEKERLEKERLEKERLEKERLEKERLEKERLEKERLEKERLEKERLEKERLEKERLEKERLEKERLEKERLEKERLEKERLEKERLEKERLEKERLEKERLEKERLGKERLEKEQLEKERLEKERLEKERLEKERLEKERLEKERLEKERLEKERLKKGSMERGVEIYLFSCYHNCILEFVVKQYQKAFPSASISICDNHTLTSELENKVCEYGCTVMKYGDKDGDLDYDTLSELYNNIWRKRENSSWVIIAPADTVVGVSLEKIKQSNAFGKNFIGIDNFTMVSRSTKKDLSDIDVKSINTGYKKTCDNILCFNKSLWPTIEYDVKAQTVLVKENAEKLALCDERCNSYSYTYMGLACYVGRARDIYAREAKWREKGYAGCMKRDINMISAELLSLPPTKYLQNMK